MCECERWREGGRGERKRGGRWVTEEADEHMVPSKVSN